MNSVPCTTSARNGHTAPAVIPQGAATLPEAACSVNIRFSVAGYGDAQATGRGATAHEAAANLRDVIDATRLALAPAAPPVPPSREERLSQLLTCGTLKAVQRGDFALVERLTKAFVIVCKGMVEPTATEGMMAVRSSKEVNTWYDVSHGTSCTCPDYARHAREGEAKHLCKHILATLFHTRLNNE